MKQIIFIALLIYSTITQAQGIIPATPCATAAEATAGNITISYTIGEITLVESWQKGNLLVTQGVLQPLQVSKEDGFGGFNDEEIKVYPNPVPNLLFIKIGLHNAGKIFLQLYDAAGKLLINENIDYSGFTTRQYQLTGYAGAAYLLRIQFHSSSGRIKQGTYKIIKTN
jgi:hypothetical protein